MNCAEALLVNGSSEGGFFFRSTVRKRVPVHVGLLSVLRSRLLVESGLSGLIETFWIIILGAIAVKARLEQQTNRQTCHLCFASKPLAVENLHHWFYIYGFNISTLAGLFSALALGLLGKPTRFLAAFISVAVNSSYELLVGAEAAVTHLAILGGLAHFARQLGRRQDGLNSDRRSRWFAVDNSYRSVSS